MCIRLFDTQMLQMGDVVIVAAAKEMKSFCFLFPLSTLILLMVLFYCYASSNPIVFFLAKSVAYTQEALPLEDDKFFLFFCFWSEKKGDFILQYLSLYVCILLSLFNAFSSSSLMINFFFLGRDSFYLESRMIIDPFFF